jgi:hypothetical protein
MEGLGVGGDGLLTLFPSEIFRAVSTLGNDSISEAKHILVNADLLSVDTNENWLVPAVHYVAIKDGCVDSRLLGLLVANLLSQGARSVNARLLDK